MKNITVMKFCMVVLLIFLTGASICSATIAFTDSTGQEISLPKTAERVVCLNSDAAEMMVVLGIGDKVVGVVESTTTDPQLMSHLPNAQSVGNWQTPSPERLLSLQPDAVVSYSSSKPKNADQLINSGIQLIYLDCYKINTLEHDVVALGIMTGAETASENYLKFFKKWKSVVDEDLQDIASDDEPAVYIEGYTDFTAQGLDSGTDLLVRMAKGKNIAADLKEQWPKVTSEWVMSTNPEVILKVVSVKPDKTLDQVREDVLKRAGFDTLSAVQNDRVYVLNGDLAYGPRSPAGLVYIAKSLHPEKYINIHPSDVLKEYSDTFIPGSTGGEYFSPTL
jgi:iron complex transport system substrate-binding protein